MVSLLKAAKRRLTGGSDPKGDGGVLVSYLDELRSALGLGDTPEFEELRQRTDKHGKRYVFKIQSGTDRFIVKLNQQGGENDAVRGEFAQLERAHRHFEQADGLSVPRPVYLSNEGTFFVMEFIDHPTSDVTIRRKKMDAAATDLVYENAGKWVQHFHRQEPAKQIGFLPRTRLGSIRQRLENADASELMKADAARAERYLAGLRQMAPTLRDRPVAEVYCHGDYWSSNLIIGTGITYGLDMAYARRRADILDFAEYMMADLMLGSRPGGLDPSGISSRSIQSFLAGYGWEGDRDILEFVVLCKLVIEWMRFTEPAYSARLGVRNRFHEAENRLDQILLN